MAHEPDEDGEEIALDEGMPVDSGDGDELGTLVSVLVDEETDEAGFLIVGAGGRQKLVPFEAVMDVEEGRLVVDVEPDEFDRLPTASAERDPTEAEMALAYRVLGMTGEDDEDDEADGEEKP